MVSYLRYRQTEDDNFRVPISRRPGTKIIDAFHL